MTIKEYLSSLNSYYKQGIATEHTFRGDLQQLVEFLVKGIKATNEPKRIQCGAPDYVITRTDRPIGFIEAKDIDVDLGARQHREQFDRYRNALNNLIITDYLYFEFYKEAELYDSVRIGEIRNGQIYPIESSFDKFTQLLNNFCAYEGQTIKSSKKLAVLMAAKARLLGEVIEKILLRDTESEIFGQYRAFQNVLIDSITEDEFADIYAQTITYGMFAARLHDDTPEDFTRKEAAEKIPKSNPFLRKMFQYIAGYDLDIRMVWIVDALADLFKHTDVYAILRTFGKSTQQHDPIIHFYETFLQEYDPALRELRGVWYTPAPVVDFIVRSVDEILKKEFGIKEGLASREKITIERSVIQSKDKRYKDNKKKEKRTYHKVQILDPATGTGTFLATIVKHIASKFTNNKGMWNGYVKEHLIPRLNGFELLMASYAMAHLKMDMVLKETGYTPEDDQRFNIYLTDSLEESHSDFGTLFASWLSDEANAANNIKRDTPIMCILGNPPYNGESANKGEWIMSLMDDYKKEPNTLKKLKERNSKWINNDYVKFIRYSQHYIERNGSGLVAFINPHAFVDNPTYRGMRWNLLKTYDKIYIVDLHGDTKKREQCPDGSKDENVFDIQQGVSINVLIKTGTKRSNQLAKVFYSDIYGVRHRKYKALEESSISNLKFSEIKNMGPMYFMNPKNYSLIESYNKSFSLKDLFAINGVGICTKRAKIAIQFNQEQIIELVEDFNNLPEEKLKIKYSIKTESRDQKVSYAQNNIRDFGLNEENFKEITYRPFDKRWTYFTNKSKGFLAYPVFDVMKHLAYCENIGIIIGRQGSVVGSMPWNLVFMTDCITDLNIYYRGGGQVFPLYVYSDQQDLYGVTKKPNFKKNIVQKFVSKLNLEFTSETRVGKAFFTALDTLDYIYAVLHSPQYRDIYDDFLKVDYPRIPYPTDQDKFWKLVELGKQIREIHLMETTGVANVSYPVEGTNEVTRRIVKKDFVITDKKNQIGRIWINEDQYFDNIPVKAWEFYIGGYQPAQKWLKDRKDTVLSFDDLEHYMNIVNALLETERLMQEIDEVGVI